MLYVIKKQKKIIRSINGEGDFASVTYKAGHLGALCRNMRVDEWIISLITECLTIVFKTITIAKFKVHPTNTVNITNTTIQEINS